MTLASLLLRLSRGFARQGCAASGEGWCTCLNAVIERGAVWTRAKGSTPVRMEPQTNRATAAFTFTRKIANVAMGDETIWIGADEDPIEIDQIGPRATEAPHRIGSIYGSVGDSGRAALMSGPENISTDYDRPSSDDHARQSRDEVMVVTLSTERELACSRSAVACLASHERPQNWSQPETRYVQFWAYLIIDVTRIWGVPSFFVVRRQYWELRDLGFPDNP